jgi:hypothetical protein
MVSMKLDKMDARGAGTSSIVIARNVAWSRNAEGIIGVDSPKTKVLQNEY